jgi:large subunit ribosomal protein L7/L12
MQTNPRLKKLKQRREQIEARIKNLEARDKSREKKRDTRRKILIGAFYMEQMEKSEEARKKILARLDGFLVRENDRELFGLDASQSSRKREGEKKTVEHPSSTASRKPDTPPKLPEKRKTA